MLRQVCLRTPWFRVLPAGSPRSDTPLQHSKAMRSSKGNAVDVQSEKPSPSMPARNSSVHRGVRQIYCSVFFLEGAALPRLAGCACLNSASFLYHSGARCLIVSVGSVLTPHCRASKTKTTLGAHVGVTHCPDVVAFSPADALRFSKGLACPSESDALLTPFSQKHTSRSNVVSPLSLIEVTLDGLASGVSSISRASLVSLFRLLAETALPFAQRSAKSVFLKAEEASTTDPCRRVFRRRPVPNETPTLHGYRSR
jgi:hypothetical protein